MCFRPSTKIAKTNEPRHEISINVVYETSNSSDQPVHTRSLIRAFASCLNILWLRPLTEHHLEFLSLKGGCKGLSESVHVKMPHCWKSHVASIWSIKKHGHQGAWLITVRKKNLLKPLIRIQNNLAEINTAWVTLYKTPGGMVSFLYVPI